MYVYSHISPNMSSVIPTFFSTSIIPCLRPKTTVFRSSAVCLQPGQPGFSRAPPTDDQRRQARPRDERKSSELPRWENGLKMLKMA